MPYYYGGQGPAQYAMSQQSRRDQQFQNMINLMLQMQQFKEGQKQFGVQQQQFEETQKLDWENLALRQKEHEELTKQREFQRQPKPYAPSEMMKNIEYLVKTGIAPDRPSAYRLVKNIKTLKRIADEAEAKAQGGGTGKFAKKTIKTSDLEKEARNINRYYDRRLVEVEMNKTTMDQDALFQLPETKAMYEQQTQAAIQAIETARKRELDRLTGNQVDEVQAFATKYNVSIEEANRLYQEWLKQKK